MLKHSFLIIMFMWHTVVLLIAAPTHLLNLTSFSYGEEWLHRQGWGSLSHPPLLSWTLHGSLDLQCSFLHFLIKELGHLSCKERLRELRLFSLASESNTLQTGCFRYSTCVVMLTIKFIYLKIFNATQDFWFNRVILWKHNTNVRKLQQLQYTIQSQYQCASHYHSLWYAHHDNAGWPQMPGRNMWAEPSSNLFLTLKLFVSILFL